MNELTTATFAFEDNEVRTVLRDGEPWFVLADLCTALGIGNPAQVATRLDPDEVGAHILNDLIDSLGRVQETLIVSEAGMYETILGSRKPVARALKRWVAHEVLPSNRKHGAYLTPDKLDEVSESPAALQQLVSDLRAELDQSRKRVELLDAAVKRWRIEISEFENRLDRSNDADLVSWAPEDGPYWYGVWLEYEGDSMRTIAEMVEYLNSLGSVSRVHHKEVHKVLADSGVVFRDSGLPTPRGVLEGYVLLGVRYRGSHSGVGLARTVVTSEGRKMLERHFGA